MRVRVRAASRLHFGLMGLGQVTGSARGFGGVGLMVEHPGVEVTVGWNATGARRAELSDRVAEILDRLATWWNDPRIRELGVELGSVAPLHTGLGTGTQLSLASAAAVGRLLGHEAAADELALATGRGTRSAIGIHGFEHGGLVVDGGKGPRTRIAPLVARRPFPEHWPIILIRPDVPGGLSGEREKNLFASAARFAPAMTDRLASLVLLGLLPALAEEDGLAFGEALFEFNRTVGECFAFAQGGAYAHPLLGRIVARLRQENIRGVGQSSWGPTLFAVCPDLERADWLTRRLAAEFDLDRARLTLTKASNRGAVRAPEAVNA